MPSRFVSFCFELDWQFSFKSDSILQERPIIDANLSSEKSVVEVAVCRPLYKTFTYEDTIGLKIGDVVEVPFGRKTVKGIVVGVHLLVESFSFQLKSVFRVFPPEYRISQEMIKLGKWLSEYYVVPEGESLLALSCPSPLKTTRVRALGRTELKEGGFPLKPSQKSAVEKISIALGQRPILLHGVTGSGKTEVFLTFIDRCLSEGKSCLFLLPEITLTRETLRKLGGRYENMLLYHSGMTLAERRESWVRSREGGPWLMVGARSSLFCPMINLGLIVVDEEHDSSYKQDSTPRYHARDLAIVRAKFAGAGVLLGSATPSLESYANAKSGKYELVQMKERISQRPLPRVHVVDLRDERREMKRFGSVLLSSQAQRMAKMALFKGHQVIFFLNRRGFSTAAICPSCGEKMECPQCAVALTHYRKSSRMICHHCDWSDMVPESCPSCGHSPMMFKGVGTEKVHEHLCQVFPEKKIVRIDGAVDGEKDIQEHLARFMEGEGDILLGTQIIAKGLDSPSITLSVALNADLGLNLPDFRAAERDFQLLTQLAGRVGRGELEGECVFQTHDPDHYAIRHGINQDYESFYEEEASFRRQLQYPPFSRMARWVFQHGREAVLEKVLGELRKDLQGMAAAEGITLLGPVPAPLAKIKGKFRWHCIAKSSHAFKLSRFLQLSTELLLKLKSVDWILDRDPQAGL